MEGSGFHMQQIGVSYSHEGPWRTRMAKEDGPWLDPQCGTSYIICRAWCKKQMQIPCSKIIQNCQTVTESIKPSIRLSEHGALGAA